MRLFLKKNGYEIYRCESCGLGMTNLNKQYNDFVKDHYSKEYFTGDPSRSAYVNYKEDKGCISKNLAKFLRKINTVKPNGRILDVGCALGFFVELALQEGFNAYGFDPSEYAVKEAEKLVGKRIKCGTIDSVLYPTKSFDIITMFDVFEHLADPAKDVKKLVTFLKDDGIIIISTGNTKSVAARLLKRRWTFYIPPQHLFFFDKATLSTLLANVGLKPVHWFGIGKWLSLRYILHLARTTGESKLGSLLYDTLRETALFRMPVYLPMGDNMVVIAKKEFIPR